MCSSVALVYLRRFSRARTVVKGGDSFCGKTPQPLADPCRPGLHLCRDLLTVQSAGSQKNHSSPLDHTLFALGASHPTQQRLFLFARKQDLRSRSTHITPPNIITLSFASKY